MRPLNSIMANSDLEALRAEALKKHKAATGKISRLRMKKEPVELQGTQFDPRRSPRAIRRYNTAQLQAYINRLDSFNARQTQFVRGARGSVITSAAWRQFQQTAARVSRRNKRQFAKISSIKLPDGTTIEERVASVTPKHPTMGTNLAANRPFEKILKSPRSMMGDKGAIKMAEEMEKRLGKGWFERRISADRESLGKMVAVMNEPDIISRIEKLNDQQFNLLWNYSGFADLLGVAYESMMEALKGEKNSVLEGPAQQSMKDIGELISWAEALNVGR